MNGTEFLDVRCLFVEKRTILSQGIEVWYAPQLFAQLDESDKLFRKILAGLFSEAINEFDVGNVTDTETGNNQYV